MPVVDFTFHPMWWHKNAGICTNERFFSVPDYRIEADIHMRKTLYERFGDLGFGEKNPMPRPILDSDMLAGEYIQAQILGCEIQFSDNNLPDIICKNMNNKEIEELNVPIIEESQAWRSIIKQIEYLENKYGYIESYIDLTGVQNLTLNLRGPLLFEDYYLNEKIARKLLDVCISVIESIGIYLKSKTTSIGIGVTSVIKHIDKKLYVTSNCTVEMISNDIYKKYLLEHDTYLSKKFQPFGIHHCGKSIQHIIEGYSKVPGVSFIEAGAFSDLKITRKYFPNTFINARYSPVKLMNSSKKEIEDDIKEMAQKAKPLNLLSFSCVGIDPEISDDKIKYFINSVRNL